MMDAIDMTPPKPTQITPRELLRQLQVIRQYMASQEFQELPETRQMGFQMIEMELELQWRRYLEQAVENLWRPEHARWNEVDPLRGGDDSSSDED